MHLLDHTPFSLMFLVRNTTNQLIFSGNAWYPFIINIVSGKILWFSGAPGMGKSTTAQILARENGYVYYEADCFGMLKNPYVPLDIDNPSLSTLKQNSLKGSQTFNQQLN